MIFGYPASSTVFGVERSKVKVMVRIRINSNMVWFRTLPSS